MAEHNNPQDTVNIPRELLRQALDALHLGACMYPNKGTAWEAITAAKENLQSASESEPTCNPHPKAPHGFNRNASHSAHRYVCDCESWDPYQAGYDEGFQAGMKSEQALCSLAKNTQALEQPAVEPETHDAKESNANVDFYSNAAINEQRRNMVREVEVGQSLGNWEHQSASNSEPQGAVAVITGFDEYGPLLVWHTHWTKVPIGTEFYTAPPAQPAVGPSGYITDPITWKSERFHSEQLVKVTQHRQPEYGYVHPVYTTAPQAQEKT